MKTWRDIEKALPSLSEQELWDMIQSERTGPRRHTVMLRLHQKYCVLRAARERAEILGVQDAQVGVA